MPIGTTITREISTLPDRSDHSHKSMVGRIAIIGGCASETMMVGAPALAANAALNSGAGLVQIFTPEPIRAAIAVLAPCATLRTLPADIESLLQALEDFKADVIGLGPGLGDSMTPDVLGGFLRQCTRPVVLDADGLNLLSRTSPTQNDLPNSTVLTPHPGEAQRLLKANSLDPTIDESDSSRQKAACSLARAYGATVVLKGRGTVVTNGDRVYINETGNAGMATGGTGDVLTGVIAALIGQGMEPFESAILGVYLHGLAGDFAAEELGRWSMTADDLLRHLPEAFCEHQMSTAEQE